ncbi:hypothetical protein ACJIZ3_023746 [Penstemon smallii]|uniref:peptidylprolyl isomerase n=1 Tax=Penstemon smallii TaxID=265156 RepID=A0ABD3TS97_9LAMI
MLMHKIIYHCFLLRYKGITRISCASSQNISSINRIFHEPIVASIIMELTLIPLFGYFDCQNNKIPTDWRLPESLCGLILGIEELRIYFEIRIHKVHYVAKWKGITFMTSRQGLGVGGGTPYGFDVGESERGKVLKGIDLGVQGMRVGCQRLLIVPPELAYGSKGVQEIPPNATIELDIELLAIKQSPFGSPVKVVEG